MTYRTIKVFDAVPGWPWQVWLDNEGYGVSSRSDTGWYPYDDVFETAEEAEAFAIKQAKSLELDAELTKSSGGAL